MLDRCFSLVFHFPFSSGKFIKARDQLRDSPYDQNNSEGECVFVLRLFFPCKHLASTSLMLFLQFVNLKIEKPFPPQKDIDEDKGKQRISKSRWIRANGARRNNRS